MAPEKSRQDGQSSELSQVYQVALKQHRSSVGTTLSILFQKPSFSLAKKFGAIGWALGDDVWAKGKPNKYQTHTLPS